MIEALRLLGALAMIAFMVWVFLRTPPEPITFSSVHAPFDLDPVRGLSVDLDFRTMGSGDFETYAALHLDEDNMTANQMSVEAAVAHLDWLQDPEAFRQFSNNTLFGIEKSSGEVVGVATIHRTDEASDGVGIGLRMAAPFRSRGYGRELMAAMIILMQHTFLFPMHVATSADNLPAQRLMNGLGYEISDRRSVPLDGTDDERSMVVYRCGVHTQLPAL